MARINYTDIATRYRDPKKGHVELERLLGQVPTPDESASLTSAYYNLKSTKSTKSSSFGLMETVTQLGSTQNITSSNVKDAYGSGTDIIQPGDIVGQSVEIAKALMTAKDGGDFKKMGTDALNWIKNEALDMLTKEVQLRNEVNSQIGVSGQLSRSLRNDILGAYEGSLQMGYGFDQLTRGATNLIKETGKFSLFNQEVLVSMAQTSRAFVGDLNKMGSILRGFEEVGIGAASALEDINEAGESSAGLGLRAKTIVELINSNLAQINRYGFSEGVEGLSRMAQKSVEFRMNMQTVFTVADKAFTLEGAMEVAAKMQALGGAIGDFMDPFKLAYMVTNDVESLGDAVVGVARNLATYNSEKGAFEVTGANLRMAQGYADILGIQREELVKIAKATKERDSVMSSLQNKGLGLSKEETEFITNMSRMDGGKMVLSVPKDLARELGIDPKKSIDLASLSGKAIESLLSFREKIVDMSTEEIAKSQYTETQRMALDVSSIVAMMKVNFSKQGYALGSEGDLLIKSFHKQAMELKESFNSTFGAEARGQQKGTAGVSNAVAGGNGTNNGTSTASGNNTTKAELKVTMDVPVGSEKMGSWLTREYVNQIQTKTNRNFLFPQEFIKTN